ncbi:MAG TPA: glycoside hydrolase family 32 protein [Roseiflexaceae bacterium]|nr:glycoside hydrolase family 32 protein [Roseiflexaceae bacterium]
MEQSTQARHADQQIMLERYAQDPQRPRYHFLPPANWLNDPNGLIHWNGAYHMFYQYNPDGPFHGNIQWGHAVSADLVYWQHLPIALAPELGTADQDGCWSGCAVDNDGIPTLIYTGFKAGEQRPCLATSADDLRTWHKYAGNPIIPAPPPDLDLVGFRDHSVWKQGDTWYQLIGAGIRGVGGTALLYRSSDLLRWEYLHPILVGDLTQTGPLWTGTMWECPDLFALSGKHVLVISVWDEHALNYPIAFVGDYAGLAFAPEQVGKLDFGASFYAPQTMRDAEGRRIMFGWLREERDEQAQREAGWSGVMSLPRVLALREDGVLTMRPATELERLRGRHLYAGELDLAEAASRPSGVRGDALEIVAEVDLGQADEISVVLRRSPDGAEQTCVRYRRADSCLILDTTRASLSPAAHGAVHSGPLELTSGEPLRLRIFLDGSVVEVFANDRVCISGRIYPTRTDSLGIDLVAEGAARLRALDIWELRSIWDQS